MKQKNWKKKFWSIAQIFKIRNESNDSSGASSVKSEKTVAFWSYSFFGLFDTDFLLILEEESFYPGFCETLTIPIHLAERIGGNNYNPKIAIVNGSNGSNGWVYGAL